MLWYGLKGAGKWIKCELWGRAGRKVSLLQLDTCRACPSAECHEALGCLYLSCGPTAEDRTKEERPTCGCLLAWISPGRRKKLRPEGRAAVLAAMVTVGKTRCKAKCDQQRWP